MSDITLLDGSIGQELVKRSGDQPTPLWSTQVMIEHPELVRQVHDAYFSAGATVATANTYTLLRDRLERYGSAEQFSLEKFEELHRIACRMATDARNAHGAGRVAGSLGPLVASYRPDTTPPPDVAAQTYAKIVRIQDPHVDLFIIETVSSVDQAEGAMMGTYGTLNPVWLSISVDDDNGNVLRSGEPVADILPLVEVFKPAAVLVNCSRPEAVTMALETVRGFGVPFGAYANGFTRISEGFLKDAPTVDALEQRTDLGPEAYARFAMGWVEQGASIVGGCCEVGPEHIAELARQLRAAGHRIV